MESWCHPILAQHIYGEMLSHIRLSLSWFILHCSPETKSPYPQQLTSNQRLRIRRREDTGVAIGADDHGVGAFSTNFLLSSLKPSVRVLLRTLKPGVRVCINQNETKVFVTLATTIYISRTAPPRAFLKTSRHTTLQTWGEHVWFVTGIKQHTHPFICLYVSLLLDCILHVEQAGIQLFEFSSLLISS